MNLPFHVVQRQFNADRLVELLNGHSDGFMAFRGVVVQRQFEWVFRGIARLGKQLFGLFTAGLLRHRGIVYRWNREPCHGTRGQGIGRDLAGLQHLLDENIAVYGIRQSLAYI